MKSISDLLPNTERKELTLEEKKARSEKRVNSYNNMQGNLDEFDCPLCKNKGRIQKSIYNEMYNDYIEVMTDCECMKRRKVIQRARRSGLGIYLDKTFGDYIATDDWQKQIKAKAIEYCKEDNNNWFIALGQSGSGKTLISCIIANYLLKQKGKEVTYITWTDFISKLKRDIMSDNNDEVSKYMNKVKNVEVLYIDELLKKYSEADLKYIIEIINYRYTNNLKTIITSERTIDNLIDIDEATFSRMIEKSGKYIISINTDRRKNYRLRNVL